MTHLSETRRATRLLPRLRWRSLIDRILAADARYREMRSLERLDDHLLRDIGVTTAEVRRELSRTIWRLPPV